MVWRDALLLSLMARLASLIEVHRNCLLLRRALEVSPVDSEERRIVFALLKTRPRRTIERDYVGSFAASASTATALFVASILWIESGWQGGTNAVMMAGVFFAIYSGAGNPALLLRNKLIGVAIRSLLAMFYVLVVMPSVDSFPLLVLALTPALILSGVLMTVPRHSPLAFNLIVGLFNPTIIATHFDPDFAEYLNGSLSTATGITFALVMMSMMQSLWLKRGAFRMLRAGWLDIARGRYEPVARWRSRMGHRLALLTARSVNAEGSNEATRNDAVRDLRAGIALSELAALRAELPQRGRKDVSLIADDVATYYRCLLRGAGEPPPQSLLARIDHGLGDALEAGEGRLLRSTIIALVGLRQTLFPAEPRSADMVRPARATNV
jgi:uncharacterized membrane protein YccC